MKHRAGMVLGLGISVMAAWCHNKPPVDERYDVHSGLEDVQIAPSSAASAIGNASRKFRLSAWYRGDSNNAVAGPGPLTWSLKLNGTTTNLSSGDVTIPAFPTAGSQVGEVRVTDQSDDDTVKVTLWAGAAAASSDGDVLEITEPAASATSSATSTVDPPNVALVESRISDCQWTRPLAFVGAVSVGEQTAIPCSLAVFFPRHGMEFQDGITDATWLNKGARFSLPLKETLPVKIVVFLAVTQTAPPQATNQQPPTSQPVDPRQLAELDVQRANLIWEDSRAGLKIDADYIELPITNDLPIRIGADPYDCTLPPNLPRDSNKPDYAYNPYRVSVYYVDRINFPLDPVQPRVRGIQCHYWYSGNPAVGTPPGNGPVVFISYSHHSPVTLAHEIGHALGLNDEEGRLGNRDVMHNLLPDGPLGADARSHLSLGQVFRMNVWNDSWINTRKPAPPQRACDANQSCPPIELDPDDY